MENTIKSGEILCVGTELLIGQIVNTNAAWLARQLTLLGISSYYQTVVGDNPERVLAAMQQSAARSDLIVVTGGLGPTADDLTMAVAASLIDKPMVMHEPSRSAIADYFKRVGRCNVSANIWKQAMLPEGAIIMPNHNGTAPGAILEFTWSGQPKVMILLPGPPSEMHLMFSESAAPYLERKTSTRFRHHFIRMIGIGESAAETELKDLIDRQENPTLAPYASEGEVMFRVTQLIHDDDEPDNTLPLLAEIDRRIGRYIYEIGERTMPQVVMDLLAESGYTISFAESCTAGLAAATLAEHPGASAVFKGGVVAYDNSIKEAILHVPGEIIAREGAVSEACAIAMATGCRDVFNTDLAVAITGIAGPDGGSAEKPVGLVWLAAATADGVTTRRLQLAGNRARIRKVATLQAFDLARQTLLT